MLRARISLLLFALASAARAEAPPPRPPPAVSREVVLEIFARGFQFPVGLVYAPGDPQGRLFVVEKVGLIRVLKNGRTDPTPFLDLSTRVTKWTEQGLLGLAFHPHFADNGRFYVNYTDLKGEICIVEYRVTKDGTRADPSTARELVHIKHPFVNHDGGDLVFGPDGKLYIGEGDGGSHGDPYGNGQNPKTLLGKMLRLDVDAEKPEAQVIQLGLRNPWRYSFDRKTGDLYIADVGQDRWEEVDVVPAGSIGGQNFGWNLVEGFHCFRGSFCDSAKFTPPVLEYSHQVGCSITGGYVYRGKALPELDGLYFYADYCTATLRSFRWKAGRVQDHWDWKPLLDPEAKLAQLATFGEDADGELYLVSLEGTIYKFVRRAH
jgi:glucose/arabinose dehydrogenase